MARSHATDLLLHEMEAGFVVPERYSRKSRAYKVQPLATTALLAFIAIVGSMLLCEVTGRDER